MQFSKSLKNSGSKFLNFPKYLFIKVIIALNPFLQDSLNHLSFLLSLFEFYWNVNYISSKIGLKTELKIIFQISTLKA